MERSDHLRIAIVSDIHGNLTAFEAVLRDLEQVAPDIVVHGGDLAASGSRPAEIVDRIRDLKWPGVLGNTDEMLWMPERVEQTLQAPSLHKLRDQLRDRVIPATCEALGEARLAWLKSQPLEWSGHGVAVVHAAPGNVWRSPMPSASDDEFEETYGPLRSSTVVYGHIHQPFVRRLSTTAGLTVANSGSVSLSYDGDPRASYAVVDGGQVTIRRVAYDIEEEIARLSEMRYPAAEWLAQLLRAGKYVPPY